MPLHFDGSFTSHLESARTRLKDRGRLGLFDGDAKRALENCTVNGRTPAAAEEVTLCLDALRRSELRRQLIAWWSNRMVHIGGPSLEGAAPEFPLGQRLDEIDRVLGRLRPGGLFFVGTAEGRIHGDTSLTVLAPGVFRKSVR